MFLLGSHVAFLALNCTVAQSTIMSTVMVRYSSPFWKRSVGAAILAVFLTSYASADPNSVLSGSELSNRLVAHKAELGDAGAMVYLGKKLVQPECTAAQQKEGVRFLALAVSAQHSEAIFTLGMLLISRASTSNEERLGLAYIERSAELGHTRAAAFLGAHLMSESQTEDQRDEAFLWLGRAASDGSVLAAMTLSELYQSDLHGVVRDGCSAASWRETAVLLRHPKMNFSRQTEMACR